MQSASELVYVVDDDGRVREALAALLRANGRDVHAFSSGREFLDTSRQHVVACLILDLRMPGMNGLEVQKLVSRDSQIPVIFITGRGDVPSTVMAMKGGAVDFLTKPVDEDALMRAVDGALARAHVLRKESEDTAALQALYQSLTPREQEHDRATDKFRPVEWEDAFARIGEVLRGLSSPNEAEFYTSGRASNEAAYLFQLLAREYGTNNFPDCSNMCHEPTSVGLPQSIGIGKGTVSLDDFEKTELILSIGHNPGTKLDGSIKRTCKSVLYI
jgi:FixJ family two-component response regulator